MIVVGGEALIDLLVGADGRITPAPGGGPFNTARTIARLGGEVSFLGRVAEDRFGRLLRERLASDGVGTGLLTRTTDPTTLVLAEIDPDGVARYEFYLAGTSAPGLEWSDAEAVVALPLAALHVGTLGLTIPPMADALARLVHSVRAETLVMVDVNCRPGAVPDALAYRARMASVLQRADIVKASVEDLDYLELAPSHEASAGILLDGRADRAVLVTRGPRAVMVHAASGSFGVPVPRVAVVDTVGAGDAFGGGFLARWLELGLGRAELADAARLRDATRFAVRVASLTCQRAGAEPPHRLEVD